MKHKNITTCEDQTAWPDAINDNFPQLTKVVTDN